MFTGASCGMTMPFLRSSLWPFPMWTAFPSSEYYGHSAPRRPAQRAVRLARAPPGWCCTGRTGTVPMFTVSRSSSEAPSSAPAAPAPHADSQDRLPGRAAPVQTGAAPIG